MIYKHLLNSILTTQRQYTELYKHLLNSILTYISLIHLLSSRVMFLVRVDRDCGCVNNLDSLTKGVLNTHTCIVIIIIILLTFVTSKR